MLNRENLYFGPKLSTTCLESAYISLLGLHIGDSERLRFDFALAVYILQTQGRMMGGKTEPERECGGDGDGDGRNYFQLRRLNSQSCRT